MKKRDFLRVLAFSDPHCGHEGGLHHHAYISQPDPEADDRALLIHRGQKERQEAFYDLLRPLKPIDYGIVVGDLVDGPGEKSYGTECYIADPERQMASARGLLRKIDAKEYVFARGTRYHVKRWIDAEKQIAGHFGGRIFAHPFVKIGGIWFDVRHKMGRSSIPHGKHTPAARARMINALASIKGRQPLARVILRGHVHEHNFCGNTDWIAMTLPGLQGHSDYGGMEVDGTVDFGFVTFDIYPDGDFTWASHTVELAGLRADCVEL